MASTIAIMMGLIEMVVIAVVLLWRSFLYKGAQLEARADGHTDGVEQHAWVGRAGSWRLGRLRADPTAPSRTFRPGLVTFSADPRGEGSVGLLLDGEIDRLECDGQLHSILQVQRVKPGQVLNAAEPVGDRIGVND